MKKILRISILSYLLLSLIILINPVASDDAYQASEVKNNNPADISKPINDGPYIFNQSDSSFIVFYICEGFFENQLLKSADTIKFRGFCSDTDEVYTVSPEANYGRSEIFTDVARILPISDIHGWYDKLVDILAAGGVIDENQQWIFGDGHLVINGDVFDRGAFVTECLWLIYRLEQEAKRTGGEVPYILGNHELMVLRGDNRYINNKYIDGIVKVTAIDHQYLYGKQFVLGRWLRTRNTVVKINDILFVHGGISPSIVERYMSMGEINRIVRDNIDVPDSSAAFTETADFLFGSGGPLWYRGYFHDVEKENTGASEEEINKILSYFDVNKIVVGHTGVDSIMWLYNNKVIAAHVDLDLDRLDALLWQDGKFYRISESGKIQALD